MGRLRTNGRIRIESVRLHEPTGGVVLAGAFVGPDTINTRSTVRGSPADVAGVPLRNAVGAVLPPGTKAELVVGLRVTRLGVARVHGVDVHYLKPWHGIDIRRRAHIGLEVNMRGVTHSVLDCNPPEPDYLGHP